MPKRTNKEQEIIALLRRALTPDCEFEESAMLTDAVTGDDAEVDIVMRCVHEDLELVVSFEIVARSRKAGRPWVHEMIRKHEHLVTEKLVLVSWSGFTGPAERVALATPHVTLLAPQTVVAGGVAKIRSLGAAEVRLSPTTVILKINKPDGTTARVKVDPQTSLFDKDGNDLVPVFDLAKSIVKAAPIGRRVLNDALNHHERDSLKWFVLGVPLFDLEMFLHQIPTNEFHRITDAEITGKLKFKHQKLDLTLARLGEVLFGYGDTWLGGRNALVAARINEDDSIGTGTLRLYEDNEKPK